MSYRRTLVSTLAEFEAVGRSKAGRLIWYVSSYTTLSRFCYLSLCKAQSNVI